MKITQPLREKQIGPNDYKKQVRVKEIEDKLKEYSSKDIINQEAVDLAIESAILSRDLEESEVVVVGKFTRALRFAKEKNNYVAQKNILYDLAWYYHWWLNDVDNFEKYYNEYEIEVAKNKDIDEILKLANLWTLLFGRKNRDKDALKEKTDSLIGLLLEKTDSRSKVTQLKANTRLCFIKIFLEEEINNQLEKLIIILKESTKYKEYDFVVVAKMIENLLPIFKDNKVFLELYDFIIENLATRKGDIIKAKMFLNKAKLLSENAQHYEAINLLGKCLTLLYKEESNRRLVEAYVNIGANFEAVGLLYAAKNYYIAAVTLFIDLFFEDNELEPMALKILDRIVQLELQFGNVEMVNQWMYVRNIFISILSDKNTPHSLDAEENHDHIDVGLAIEILQTKLDDFNKMDRMIEDCSKNGLIFSEFMSKYVIGEYDEQTLKEYSGNKDEIDKLIMDFYSEAMKQKIPLPRYNNGEEDLIISKLSGNNLKIYFTSTNLSHRFAEFIAALLENSFATIHNHKAYICGDIKIRLKEQNTGTFSMKYSFDGVDTYNIILDSIDMYDISIENQQIITDELFKLLAHILAINFIYDNYENTFKEIFDDEKSFERSFNHTSSIYNINKILGCEKEKEIISHNIIREKEWYKDIEMAIIKDETVDPFENIKEFEYVLPEKNQFKNVSHEDIYSSNMINVTHWDLAQWKGMMYLGNRINPNVIKIGFIFENEEGAKRVFQDFIDNVGKNDEKGEIILSFIKGINEERIYDYRVMITGKVKIPKDNNKDILVQMRTRFHEMNCKDDKNIKILEHMIMHVSNHIIKILPIIIYNNSQNFKPLWDYEITLNRVNIKNAYEIGKGDYEAMAILKSDKPVIPNNVINAPIIELISIKNKTE